MCPTFSISLARNNAVFIIVQMLLHVKRKKLTHFLTDWYKSAYRVHCSVSLAEVYVDRWLKKSVTEAWMRRRSILRITASTDKRLSRFNFIDDVYFCCRSNAQCFHLLLILLLDLIIILLKSNWLSITPVYLTFTNSWKLHTQTCHHKYCCSNQTM